ncbi:MAG: hypothetical protein KKG93_02925 [Bacteroidetes bacterium]|nr:hypothetical protein [Bacteroidota bacterium]
MSISTDMKTLASDIIASYNTRIKAIGTIVKDTNNLLKGYNKEHKDMAGSLKASLAKGETDRLNNFKEMMGNIQKFVADLTKNVDDMIKKFQKEHKDMADALKASLAKGETDRLNNFTAMMGNIQKDIKEIEAYVKNKLKEFSDAHAEMSEELKKELAKYVDDMVNATQKLMGDIQARQKERNAQVTDLLDSYKTEREKMAANWNSLVATMAKKRGVKPEVEAEVKVRPVKEAIEEEVSSEMSLEKLEKKVLKFIEKHSGVKIGDMEEPLGVNRMTLGQIAKKLLDEGKVRKEENLYFPL